jgi:general L-amino acid transport system substrate-binding protein
LFDDDEQPLPFERKENVMRMLRATWMAVAGFAATISASSANAGASFDAVKTRGELICGVRDHTVGLAHPLANGEYVGLAVDICRAMSAAIFGNATKVKFVPLPSDRRFGALKAGEVDVLVAETPVTMVSEIELGLTFSAVYFHSDQGVLIRRSLGKRTLMELNGLSICMSGDTAAERNLQGYFRPNNLTYKPVVLQKAEDLRSALFAARCQAYTGDLPILQATRIAYAPTPHEYMILPETLAHQQLGLVVRNGDAEFNNIARWSFNAMIQAEEHGITSANVDDMLKKGDDNIRRLLGATPGVGAALKVDDKWVYNIVRQVGNYGESYDRNLGSRSVVGFNRGPNALVSQGGMLYSPPIN